jgi:hypothetical protein
VAPTRPLLLALPPAVPPRLHELAKPVLRGFDLCRPKKKGEPKISWPAAVAAVKARRVAEAAPRVVVSPCRLLFVTAITCRAYYKLSKAVRVGGGGEWRNCAMRNDSAGAKACMD